MKSDLRVATGEIALSFGAMALVAHLTFSHKEEVLKEARSIQQSLHQVLPSNLAPDQLNQQGWMKEAPKAKSLESLKPTAEQREKYVYNPLFTPGVQADLYIASDGTIESLICRHVYEATMGVIKNYSFGNSFTPGEKILVVNGNLSHLQECNQIVQGLGKPNGV